MGFIERARPGVYIRTYPENKVEGSFGWISPEIRRRPTGMLREGRRGSNIRIGFKY
jgi:hypothetical protein